MLSIYVPTIVRFPSLCKAYKSDPEIFARFFENTDWPPEMVRVSKRDR
jgi:hypothetical protein